MNLISHLVQRVQRLSSPPTRALVVERGPAGADAGRDRPARRSLGPEVRWGRPADRAGAVPVRQDGTGHRVVGTAVGRARVPGPGAEHARHLRFAMFRQALGERELDRALHTLPLARPTSWPWGATGQLRDFRAMRDAGRAVRLTVGPWPHMSFRAAGQATRPTTSATA